MTIPSGFAQITHRLLTATVSRPMFVTYGVANATNLDPDDVAQNAHGAIGAHGVNVLTTDVTLSSTIAKLGPDETGPSFEYSGGSYAGTAPPPTMPPNVAYLVHKNTTLGGRRGRGRMYFPGVREAYVTQWGQLDSVVLADMTTAMGALLTELAAADIPMVVLHGPKTEWVLNEDGQPRREPIAGAVPAPSLVTSIQVDTRAATQRRRLRG